ncbi:MAG: hypothetical protein QM780_01005 [Hyphomicrobium sp.]|uniref:hypothetical protein n=1 Tax=Hyphomicrobium sp. TaxID=82 RepID=UPI0039E435FC
MDTAWYVLGPIWLLIIGYLIYAFTRKKPVSTCTRAELKVLNFVSNNPASSTVPDRGDVVDRLIDKGLLEETSNGYRVTGKGREELAKDV